jgi:alkylation response protein AidB-like acyl-CoA dehydrogenase
MNISATGFGADRNSGPSLADIAKKYVGVKDGILADGDLRSRIAKQMMYEQAFVLTIQRNAEMAKAGADVGPATSIVKYAAAKMNQNKTELQVEAMGHQGLGWEGDGFRPGEILSTRAMLRAKGNSIEGGTSEVNLNVIAKRVLGLRDHQ